MPSPALLPPHLQWLFAARTPIHWDFEEADYISAVAMRLENAAAANRMNVVTMSPKMPAVQTA